MLVITVVDDGSHEGGYINEERFRGEAREFSRQTFPWASTDSEVRCYRDTVGQQMELVCTARLCTYGRTYTREIVDLVAREQNNVSPPDSRTHVQRPRTANILPPATR
jgi:hypothetical protein